MTVEHGTDSGCRSHYAKYEDLCDACSIFWELKWIEKRKEREALRRKPPSPEERLTTLVGNAMRRLRMMDGEWENWRSLRPPYRDRPLYDDTVWQCLSENPEVETVEESYGNTVRRKARFVGLL